MATLKLFKDEYPDDLDFLDVVEVLSESEVVNFSLDLKDSQRDKLGEFFNRDGVKYKFAERYVKLLSSEHPVPDWVYKIREWIG